jgi:hypothetical protein
MKGKFCLSLFALCALMFGNAIGQERSYGQEQSYGQEPYYLQEGSYVETYSVKKADSFNYLKLGVGGAKGGVGPSIGIGRRFGMEGAAIDVSANWTGSNRTGYFSLPKMLYLSYLTPNCPSSFYYGAGLSFGGIGAKCHTFSGLLAEGAVGYEFQRDSDVKLFAELDFSHGVVPFSSKHGFNGFNPAIAFSVGAGF